MDFGMDLLNEEGDDPGLGLEGKRSHVVLVIGDHLGE